MQIQMTMQKEKKLNSHYKLYISLTTFFESYLKAIYDSFGSRMLEENEYNEIMNMNT